MSITLRSFGYILKISGEAARRTQHFILSVSCAIWNRDTGRAGASHELKQQIQSEMLARRNRRWVDEHLSASLTLTQIHTEVACVFIVFVLYENGMLCVSTLVSTVLRSCVRFSSPLLFGRCQKITDYIPSFCLSQSGSFVSLRLFSSTDRLDTIIILFPPQLSSSIFNLVTTKTSLCIKHELWH